MDKPKDMILLEDLDLDKIQEETKGKLDGLCQEVFGQNLQTISKDQLEELISLEINTSIETLDVYCQQTRQLEQFTPNVYSITQKINLSDAYKYLKERVKGCATAEEMLEKYLDLKVMFYKLIAFKFHNTEDFLRNLLREAEIKDGIAPKGRFVE